MKRGAPLRPGKGFKPRTEPMARGTSTLARTPMPRGTAVLKAKAPMQRNSAMARSQDEPPKPKKRSRGLKGRPPTAAEQAFMDRAGQVPCLACAKDGRENKHISLHHVDGRTKPGAHFKVLPICPPHHQQDDSDPLQRPSVHGRKATFTARYGTEAELLAELYAMLSFTPPQHL